VGRVLTIEVTVANGQDPSAGIKPSVSDGRRDGSDVMTFMRGRSDVYCAVDVDISSYT